MRTLLVDVPKSGNSASATAFARILRENGLSATKSKDLFRICINNQMELLVSLLFISPLFAELQSSGNQLEGIPSKGEIIFSLK